MKRPKGMAATALLMALCNAVIWATIKPGRPPYSTRMFLAFTVLICVGYVFIWFYWQGRNWARVAVLLFSVWSICNLMAWNTVSTSPALLTTPAHVLMLFRAILGLFLLYWLNTRAVVEFFGASRKLKPPPAFRL